MWSYICSKCEKAVEETDEKCPHCKLKLYSLEDYKKMEGQCSKRKRIHIWSTVILFAIFLLYLLLILDMRVVSREMSDIPYEISIENLDSYDDMKINKWYIGISSSVYYWDYYRKVGEHYFVYKREIQKQYLLDIIDISSISGCSGTKPDDYISRYIIIQIISGIIWLVVQFGVAIFGKDDLENVGYRIRIAAGTEITFIESDSPKEEKDTSPEIMKKGEAVEKLSSGKKEKEESVSDRTLDSGRGTAGTLRKSENITRTPRKVVKICQTFYYRMEEGERNWICVFCGVENAEDAMLCEVCDSARNTAMQRPKWVCKICGMENTEDAVFCEGCNNARRWEEKICSADIAAIK